MKYLAALVMFLMDASAADAAASGDVQLTSSQANNIRLNHAGLLFLPLVFLFVALSAAWMINTDNAPDTTRDSILYSKFLTQRVDKSKIE